MNGNFDGRSEQGERGESPTSEAINGILADEKDKLFSVEHGELKAELSKVQRLSSLEDAELTELLQMLRGLKISANNAVHAVKEGRALFGVETGVPKDDPWGSEGVMKRTHVLAAKKEHVDLIFALVLAEKTKRGEAKTLRKREAELDVYEKVFEGLSREQIVEKLLEHTETLLGLQEKIFSLRGDLDYSSDLTGVGENLGKASEAFHEIKQTIAAGKRRIGKKL